MTTGFFGVPGSIGGKVHAVENRKPACGTRISPWAEYQWCSPRIRLDYIECEKCLVIVQKILEKRHAERMEDLNRRLRRAAE